MSLKGKKVAVLLETLYNELEFWYPYYRMKEAGAEVVVVAPKRDTYASKIGMTAASDKAASEVSADDFDAVIIPGGYAPDHMRRSKELVEFVRRLHENGRVVAAICHAGWMLVSAGILKGKTVTSFYAIRDDLVNAGATWVDKEVVKDGNLITSRTPADLPVFCAAIIAKLEG